MKNIVITGSSKGIGYGLAAAFLKKGHAVNISGRNEASLRDAADKLATLSGSDQLNYIVCDVTKTSMIEELWAKAAEKKPIDIWINNAGLGQNSKLLTELEFEVIDSIIDTNIKGLVYCSKIVFQKMKKQGFGAIYNMEGFGSDGRKMKRMSIYGTSKRSVRYFSRSLALEAKDTSLIIGTISPGMVVTDLLINPIKNDSITGTQAKKIFNLLADNVETVTPWLANKILNNKKNGAHYNWLSGTKIMKRFFLNIFKKRKVEGIPI